MVLATLDSVFVSPALSGILGLLLGSFYNVCIHRYLHSESIIRPASHCPQCGHTLSWWENIPLISFVLLKARCRFCKTAISWQYPLVEGISGTWAFLLALQYGLGWSWLVFLVFGGLLIIMSAIDLKIFVLPDILTISGSILALPCAVYLLDHTWQSTLLGGLIGAGSFFLLQQGYKLLKGIEGLGTGDIKLMFLLGALLGWQSLPILVFLAAISGLIVSIIFFYTHIKQQGMQTAIPFGPFLSFGGMIYMLMGTEIWRWYLTG
jgi:leader peptidase (prepilin peptidase)/N-methyltransferase